MDGIIMVPPLKSLRGRTNRKRKPENSQRCSQAEILLDLSWDTSAPKWKKKTKSSPFPQLNPPQQRSAGILGRGTCFPQTFHRDQRKEVLGNLFLIKELVTVTLVLADATNNNQDLAPLKCIINRRHSLLSTPAPTSFPLSFTRGCLRPKWHRNLSFLISIQRNK